MKNKLIIINGATGGLGFSIVKNIIKIPKYRVICLVRDINNIGKISEILNSDYIFQIDLDNCLNLDEFEKYLSGKVKNEDIYFINNASKIKPLGKLGTFSNQDIIKSINFNITANLLLVNSILKIINNFSNLYILNISSGIANNPLPGFSLYGIGKNYLDYLTNVLNLEKSVNIKVSSFYPGSMKTEMRYTLLEELKKNKELLEFDYNNLINQSASHPDYIANIIIKNYILEKSGWQYTISKFYDYE